MLGIFGGFFRGFWVGWDFFGGVFWLGVFVCLSLLLWGFGWGFWFGIWFFLLVIVLSIPTPNTLIFFLPAGKKKRKWDLECIKATGSI